MLKYKKVAQYNTSNADSKCYSFLKKFGWMFLILICLATAGTQIYQQIEIHRLNAETTTIPRADRGCFHVFSYGRNGYYDIRIAKHHIYTVENIPIINLNRHDTYFIDSLTPDKLPGANSQSVKVLTTSGYYIQKDVKHKALLNPIKPDNLRIPANSSHKRVVRIPGSSVQYRRISKEEFDKLNRRYIHDFD